MLKTADLSVYFGGLKAVEKVALEVHEGEILSLIGPNGAGKTTFFNLVSGFLKPTSGSVHFMDRDITGLPPHEIAGKGLIRTFQKTNIFADVSVEESIRIGFHLHRQAGLFDILTAGKTSRRENAEVAERSKDILSFTGLYSWKNHLVKNIPYGKQRMLAIALALAANPRLLLLDEPATGLNPVETQELMDIILKIRREKKITIFLIEHNMNLVVAISDRLAVLCYGEKLTEGKPEEVSKDPRVIEAYLGRGYNHAAS
ncbi:MAG: ABC transporter ATP-binding protein [Synergistaceae bacterium]|jgi:branched-chain amino acid transport system ATP-binding protein|nr:ABC transporter ATP-binding protein [Synergistaceae bacterium]